LAIGGLLAIWRLLAIWGLLAVGRLLLSKLLSRRRLTVSWILLRGILALRRIGRLSPSWRMHSCLVRIVRVAGLTSLLRSSTRSAGRRIIALAAGWWGRTAVAVRWLLRAHYVVSRDRRVKSYTAEVKLERAPDMAGKL
jgi:hypothetical protein